MAKQPNGIQIVMFVLLECLQPSTCDGQLKIHTQYITGKTEQECEREQYNKNIRHFSISQPFHLL